MTIHIKTNGGYMRGGKLYGRCEKYIADDLGNGTIYRGIFQKNNLSDPSGEVITFTDNKVKIYKGEFVDGLMSGDIEETIIDLSPLPEDEKDIGNCSCGTRNRKLIKASNDAVPIISVKKIATYANGIRAGEQELPPESKLIAVSQRTYNGRLIFDGISIA